MRKLEVSMPARLYLLIGASAMFLVANLYFAVILYSALPRDRVNSMLVSEEASTEESAAIAPLVDEAITSQQVEAFARRLIREYVVARYTISGTARDESLCLTKKSLKDLVPTDCLILGLAGWNFDKGEWSAAVLDFLDGTDGERKEMEDLRTAKITRSVRILAEPSKFKAEYRVPVEFIYKDPKGWGAGAMRREYWTIYLDADGPFGLRDASVLEAAPPSALFAWRVNMVKKRKGG